MCSTYMHSDLLNCSIFVSNEGGGTVTELCAKIMLIFNPEKWDSGAAPVGAGQEACVCMDLDMTFVVNNRLLLEQDAASFTKEQQDQIIGEQDAPISKGQEEQQDQIIDKLPPRSLAQVIITTTLENVLVSYNNPFVNPNFNLYEETVGLNYDLKTHAAGEA